MAELRMRDARRVFSRDKSIDSDLLNKLGVQVFRCVAARSLYATRAPLWRSTPAEMPDIAPHVAELRRTGVAVIENFLPEDVFSRLFKEVEHLLSDDTFPREWIRHGSNDLEVIYLKSLSLQQVPEIRRFFGDERITALAESAERRPLRGEFGVRTIERLTQQTGDTDEQAELHSDIFFTVHKAWLYLTDVTEQDGPLVYVKGSHRLSATQMRFLYRESCGRNQGSRRIPLDEVRLRGLEPTVLTCRRNTFVIANTMGYHCRQQGWPPGRRVALHLSLRGEPFSLAGYRALRGAGRIQLSR